MKYIKTYENSKNFFYRADSNYTLSDIDFCSKSKRTFDIDFFDLVKNKRLQQVLFKLELEEKDKLANFLSSDKEKKNHLLTNPKLRILVLDEDLFLDVLEIFNPDDIRVSIRKYNL